MDRLASILNLDTGHTKFTADRISSAMPAVKFHTFLDKQSPLSKPKWPSCRRPLTAPKTNLVSPFQKRYLCAASPPRVNAALLTAAMPMTRTSASYTVSESQVLTHILIHSLATSLPYRGRSLSSVARP